MKIMYDFFVSHSSIDKDNIVDELVNTLQNMGYYVWYDRNEILAGDDSYYERGSSQRISKSVKQIKK